MSGTWRQWGLGQTRSRSHPVTWALRLPHQLHQLPSPRGCIALFELRKKLKNKELDKMAIDINQNDYLVSIL